MAYNTHHAMGLWGEDLRLEEWKERLAAIGLRIPNEEEVPKVYNALRPNRSGRQVPHVEDLTLSEAARAFVNEFHNKAPKDKNLAPQVGHTRGEITSGLSLAHAALRRNHPSTPVTFSELRQLAASDRGARDVRDGQRRRLQRFFG